MDIFVGSLPFKLKESELREAFEKFGEVSSVKIVIDKIRRQSKGFGFVEMPDDRQALQAISKLNGTELMGRTIIVTKSEKKESSEKSTKKPGSALASKTSPTWRKNFFRKGVKPSIVTFGDGDTGNKKKGPKVKSAKNFKVGKKRR